MSQQDPPIVISGGSVTIEFKEESFTKNGNKYSNGSKKIRRVDVTVNGNTQTIPVPNGKVTVEVHYSD